jgi:ABC-type sulfate/molybdate transport systems ATPase subunit
MCYFDLLLPLLVSQIIVTHDQEEAFDLADKVVIFNRWAPEASHPGRKADRHAGVFGVYAGGWRLEAGLVSLLCSS